MTLSPPSSSIIILHKLLQRVPSPIRTGISPCVHTKPPGKQPPELVIFMISGEPDGASAACQCQSKDHIAAAGGDLGSWLHQGTKASCRPLPQPQLNLLLPLSVGSTSGAGTACPHSPFCPSGIKVTCMRTSFTVASCAWRLGQQGNQGNQGETALSHLKQNS